MKNARRKDAGRPAGTPVPVPSAWSAWWWWALAALAGLLAVFECYSPSLHGPFVFDDLYLPFQDAGYFNLPAAKILGSQRPLLNLTYWLNGRLLGPEPYSFHVVNVLLHFLNSVLLAAVLRRLLAWSGVDQTRRSWLAVFAGALFLLHPALAESVAYVAGRSETLSVFFFLAAFAVFLYRRQEAATWPLSAAVLLLFAGAVASKEHAVVLPGLLLLTDIVFAARPVEAVKRNWRLYLPLAAIGAGGLAFVWKVLAGADTAGFAIKGLPWYQYFYTQWRAVWLYLRLSVLPYGLNADYDFPISRSPLDHGALAGLLALLALLALAWRFRRTYPLAFYGLLVFLLLLAPTSSVVPIKDPVAERRLYLPFIGLLLVGLEFLRRVHAGRLYAVAGAAVLLAWCGWLAQSRSRVWSDDILLWEDTVRRSPANGRAHFQLALTYFQAGRCADSLPHYEQAAQRGPIEHRLLVDWGLALDCLDRGDAALEKLRAAAAMENTGHVHSLIGMVYAKQRRLDAALKELDEAARLEPGYDMTYVYRGNVYALQGEWTRAAADYRRALAISPGNQAATEALANAGRHLPAP